MHPAWGWLSTPGCQRIARSQNASSPVQTLGSKGHSRTIARERTITKNDASELHPRNSDALCPRMSDGDSLRAICRDSGYPIEGAVRGWAVRDVDGFADRYRSARLLLMEFWSDQIVDMADESELDPRDRQICTAVCQWIMARISPRRRGDKVQLGSDPESPLRIMHQQKSLENLTAIQLGAFESFALSLLTKPQQTEAEGGRMFFGLAQCHDAGTRTAQRHQAARRCGTVHTGAVGRQITMKGLSGSGFLGLGNNMFRPFTAAPQI